MKNYLKIGEPLGSYELYAFGDKYDESARRLKILNEVIFIGTRYELQEKVRLAKKVIPSKKLKGKDGTEHTFYFGFGSGKFTHQTPLAAMSDAVNKLDEMYGKPNKLFIIIKT